MHLQQLILRVLLKLTSECFALLSVSKKANAAVDSTPFFSFAAAFDKKYRAAYLRLSGTLGRDELRKKRAQPPSPKAIDCRRSFHPTLEC